MVEMGATGKGGVAASGFESPFLDLRCVADMQTWRADVPEYLCVGKPDRQFLFGGATLAGCIHALEEAAGGEPIVNITCQFIAFAQAGQNIEFAPNFDTKGRTRQAAIEIKADGRLFARALASVGRRGGDGEECRFVCPVDVPAPFDCPERSIARRMSSNIQNLIEFRLIDGEMPDRADWSCKPVDTTRFWLRARAGNAASRPLLALMGDFLAIGIPGAMGRAANGTSLDNTVRFVGESDGEWVFCDTRVQWIGRGILHGQLTMHDEAGKLLAIASQSMVVRG